MLGFDFEVFGGMGEAFSIMLGLLVPVWLIWEFDAGLFVERSYFGFAEMDGNLSVSSDENTFENDKKLGFMSVIALVLSFVSVSEGWIANDLVNALVFVISGLSLLSFLHQVYLLRQVKICESANEDFAKKRQENEVYFFLFFYTVAYLSGGKTLS
jgi:hypothetical protein